MKTKKMLTCLFLALAISLLLLPAGIWNTAVAAPSTESPDLDESAQPADLEEPNRYDIPDFRDALDDNGFFVGVRALDYIEMFSYKGLDIPYDVHQVPDDELQYQIDYILSEFPYASQVMDRAVESGDLVNIDYIGTIGGVEFDGGSTNGMGTDVIAGSSDYIDDFLDQIIGHMPGDTVDVKVTFPEDYYYEELQGKDALFVTTINYIVDMELTDDFVAENLSAHYGWTTVAEMKAGLRADIQNYSIQQYIRQYIVTMVTIKSMPDQVMDYQNNFMLEYYHQLAEYYGVELEELLYDEGFFSVDDLIETYYDYNYENAVSLLVLQAVAENAKLTVDDEDIIGYFLKYDMLEEYSSLLAQYGVPFIKQNVINQKAIDYIIDNAILLPVYAEYFPFTDVKARNWYYFSVYNMWENDLMNGTSATRFSPNAPLTRSMAVTVLWRMAGSPDVIDPDMPFSDVADDWYYNAVMWAAEEGIVTGYKNGAFRPGDTIFRQDLALILSRYADLTGIDLTAVREYAAFEDNDSIGAYAKEAVEALYESGVISGKTGNVFDPKGSATRAEFAAMLSRIIF